MSINIMTRPLVLLLLAAPLSCVPTPSSRAPTARTVVTEDPSDAPLRALSPEWEEVFLAGDAAFEARMFPAQGLGPLYIRTSCASCHADDGKGPGFVTKMVVLDDDGTPVADALPDGTTVRPFFLAPATQPLLPPHVEGVVTSTRVGPAVFGRGFVEAIADAEIERVGAEQGARTDGVSGRIHRVTWGSKENPDKTFHDHHEGDSGLIGRFGLKARVATLDEFTADAFQGDMGITSPLRPVEPLNPDGVADDAHPGVDVDADTVNAIAGYMRLLDIPRRSIPLDEADLEAAAALFHDVDCAVCHVPAMRTSPTYPIPALADRDAPIFSDLLLHDMGDGLSDGVVDGDPATGASGREWKTAPLMGLRFFDGYLHDGRAATVADAIEAHASEGSEANASIQKWRALSDEERALLLTFVEAL